MVLRSILLSTNVNGMTTCLRHTCVCVCVCVCCLDGKNMFCNGNGLAVCLVLCAVRQQDKQQKYVLAVCRLDSNTNSKTHSKNMFLLCAV